MNQKLKNNKVGILDWAIFISIFVMALMIFIPQIIWEEEDNFKKIISKDDRKSKVKEKKSNSLEESILKRLP